MFTALLHTHKLVVSLFLIHYMIKLFLLQSGKSEKLAKYSKVTKVPEMIVSALFLITGVWMMVIGAVFNALFVIKLLCVFAAIPLAIIGFKKANKGMAALSVILIIAAYGLAEMSKAAATGGKIDTSTATSSLEAGKMIYNKTCITCHGADGKLLNSGAKDLTLTQLSAEEQKELIRHGKNAMPAYKKLTDEQVDAVVEYVKLLKQ